MAGVGKTSVNLAVFPENQMWMQGYLPSLTSCNASARMKDGLLKQIPARGRVNQKLLEYMEVSS